jgi:hypothetical protein
MLAFFFIPVSLEQAEEFNPKACLESFVSEFNKNYNGRLLANIISTSELTSERTVLLHHACWITFLNNENYMYRLFEVVPKKADGGYPVNVQAFHGPPEDLGDAKDREALNALIDKKIIGAERWRNILLANY